MEVKTGSENVEERWYLVSVDRTTVYRVKATSEDGAIDTYTQEDGDEVDSTTNDMRAELDDDQDDDQDDTDGR